MNKITASTQNTHKNHQSTGITNLALKLGLHETNKISEIFLKLRISNHISPGKEPILYN